MIEFVHKALMLLQDFQAAPTTSCMPKTIMGASNGALKLKVDGAFFLMLIKPRCGVSFVMKEVILL